MANTFRKLQKRIENEDGNYAYVPLSYIGVDGVPLDIMKGASSSSDGVIGLVPKPNKGDENKVLKGDGTWGSVTENGTLSIFSKNNDGLVPKTDKTNWFLTGNGSWGYPWLGSKIKDGKTNLIIGSSNEELMLHELSEASVDANGLMSANDKSILNAINVEAFHSYSQKATSFGTVYKNLVNRVDPNNSSNQYNTDYYVMEHFINYNDNEINGKKPFTVIDTDKNGAAASHFYCGLNTNIAGYYRFDLRVAIKLDKATGHRIEYGPFVNGERIARWFNTYSHMKSYTLVHTQTCLLKLNVGDVVKFAYKIVDELVEDFSDNSITPMDTMCTLLRPL